MPMRARQFAGAPLRRHVSVRSHPRGERGVELELLWQGTTWQCSLMGSGAWCRRAATRTPGPIDSLSVFKHRR